MSELVDQTGVPAATIRYYLSAGLLPPPTKVAANRFLYDERHVEVVRLVRLIRERRSLSLEQIRRALGELLPDLLDQPGGGVFRPEMWTQLLQARDAPTVGSRVSDRLLEGAVGEFSRYGYEGVSVDDVTRVAGIAKGSFYRHFSSKEELFFAAAEEAGRRAMGSFVAAIDGGRIERNRSISVLAGAIAPYLPLLLDLSSLAARRRPGSARVLRQIVRELREGLRSHIDLDPSERSRDVFGAALVEAIQRVIGEDPDASGLG